MKKLALVFVLAIFAPALLLGVLAVRTAGRQRMIMQQQEVELRQKETDELAEKVRSLLADEQRSFLDAVERLRARVGVKELGPGFSEQLPGEWRRHCIGFAVDESGLFISPGNASKSDATTRDFLRENAAFLANKAPAEVYQANTKSVGQGGQLAEGDFSSARLKSLPSRGMAAPASQAQGGYAMAGAVAAGSEAGTNSAVLDKAATRVNADRETGVPKDAISAALDQDRVTQKLRAVIPQNQTQAAAPAVPVSQLYFATSRFRQLVAEGHDGVLARFVEDELVVIFWVRPAGLDQTILGAQVKAVDLFDAIRPGLEPLSSHDACLAVLNDRARPMAFSPVPGLSSTEASVAFLNSLNQGLYIPGVIYTSWKTPFVATEIGEALPHWEAALYLLHPDSLSQSAHLITLTLYGLVGLAIAAIGWGSVLIAVDTRRQLRLAEKKTDFVSNVSHELKTPLTSIRMFAELLQEGRVRDPAKIADYLRIIRLEAERLTRLINNVLDFARLERNQKHYTRRLTDLQPEIERLWQAQSEHLRAQGFETRSAIGPGPWWAVVDADAIVQVIVNLLSNAEKYSVEKKEIEFQGGLQGGEIRIAILDRGAGVPAGEEKKIFESFYRAHDSLSSGIPGSGLGLTLALRIARDHGGEIRCEARSGGGTIFTLRLPAGRADGVGGADQSDRSDRSDAFPKNTLL